MSDPFERFGMHGRPDPAPTGPSRGMGGFVVRVLLGITAVLALIWACGIFIGACKSADRTCTEVQEAETSECSC